MKFLSLAQGGSSFGGQEARADNLNTLWRINFASDTAEKRKWSSRGNNLRNQRRKLDLFLTAEIAKIYAEIARVFDTENADQRG